MESVDATLTIFTCANAAYEDFAGLFAASALWANPEYTVEIGVEDRDAFLSRDGAVIEGLCAHVRRNAIVLRNAQFVINGRSILPNAVRFLTSPTVRSKYVYISDIDIVTLDDDIVEQHLQHMAETGLPFSNLLTQSDRPRLSGLHFTEYSALYPLPEYVDLLSGRMNDEALLYELVRRRIGHFASEGRRFRPIHGIHVSPNRGPYFYRAHDGRVRPGWLAKFNDKQRTRWAEFRSSPFFSTIASSLSDRIVGIVREIDEFDPAKVQTKALVAESKFRLAEL